MKRFGTSFAVITMLTVMVLGVAGSVEAQKRNDREIRDTIRTLNSKIEDFEFNIRDQMQSSSANNGQVSNVSDEIRELRDSVRRFETNFEQKRDNRNDVSKIIDAARRIDGFLATEPQNRRVEDIWTDVRKQLDRLGANYGITTNWNVGDTQNIRNYPDQTPSNTINVGLSGTYQLDAARSEKIDDVVSDPNLANDQREDLKDKLTAPNEIAIDIRGNHVTLATSNASPVTFAADGSEKTEQSGNGKTIRLRATINGDVLTISSLGGDTDYTITFTSVSNGQTLKVMRRITTEYTSQTVFAESVYNKTDAVARLGIDTGQGTGSTDPVRNTGSNDPGRNTGNTDPNGTYSDNDQNGNRSNGGVYNRGRTGGQPNNGSRNGAPSVTTKPGNYTVPNGTIITGKLENEINTKVSQNNDHFRMTVQSPDEFRGAVVEGYISNVERSGKITGQSSITFNFEKITLSNGQTYDFAGNLQSATDTTGKIVRIDNESTIRGDSQTRQTATRGGVGAGLGALIGLIAGGGKGAAIGAIIGGGAGAGSTAISGKSDVQLMQGSTISVQSSSPIRQNQPRDH